VLAVLDVNVLVSAAISTAGPPREILTAWVDGRFELLASPALLAELRDVLARPRFRRWIGTATAAEFLDGLADATLIVDDPPARPDLSPDPEYLELVQAWAPMLQLAVHEVEQLIFAAEARTRPRNDWLLEDLN